MNILQKFKELLSNRIVYIVVIIILVILLLRTCRTPIENYDQNIKALTDSIRMYKAKNGDLVFEKNAFIANEKELNKLNVNLASEVKNLKDNQVVIIKPTIKIIHDTVTIYVKQGSSAHNSDSTVKYASFTWNLDTIYDINNYRKLSGDYLISVDTNLNIKTDNFRITTDEFSIGLTTGLTEKDGDVEIFIKSNYPGFTPSSIDGALFDPRDSKVIKKYFPPKRWSLGPYIGYGAYIDLSSGNVGTGVSAGVSLSYGIFQWNFKK